MKSGIFLSLTAGLLFGFVAGAVVKKPTFENLDQANLDSKYIGYRVFLMNGSVCFDRNFN